MINEQYLFYGIELLEAIQAQASLMLFSVLHEFRSVDYDEP